MYIINTTHNALLLPQPTHLPPTRPTPAPLCPPPCPGLPPPNHPKKPSCLLFIRLTSPRRRPSFICPLVVRCSATYALNTIICRLYLSGLSDRMHVSGVGVGGQRNQGNASTEIKAIHKARQASITLGNIRLEAY